MRNISASVGQGGRNLTTDVVAVQELLNKVPAGEGGPVTPLKVDGLAWDRTIGAIKRFQSINLGHKWPDGRVDPLGKTLTRLNDYDAPKPASDNYVYFVPGHKAVIAQPNLMTCWAATYTVMRSWREGKTFGIAEALERPGKVYVDLFKNGYSLPAPMFRDFWTRGGLTLRGMVNCFPPYIWHDLLTKHGLLAVGAASNMPPAPGLHLRVMEGMSVFEAPGDCYYIIDPGWGGQKYPEPKFEFEVKYNYAMSMTGGAGWQIAHYW